jgi:hypothetical protein
MPRRKYCGADPRQSERGQIPYGAHDVRGDTKAFLPLSPRPRGPSRAGPAGLTRARSAVRAGKMCLRHCWRGLGASPAAYRTQLLATCEHQRKAQPGPRKSSQFKLGEFSGRTARRSVQSSTLETEGLTWRATDAALKASATAASWNKSSR